MVTKALILAGLAFILGCLSGCMQLTGAKKIDAWGLVIESNSGFEVSAGAMQYDHTINRKGMNIEAKDNKASERY